MSMQGSDRRRTNDRLQSTTTGVRRPAEQRQRPIGFRLCYDLMHWRIQPLTKRGAKTGQCRRDTGSPGLHRESSFLKGGPNRIFALLNLNLARLAPPPGSASEVGDIFATSPRSSLSIGACAQWAGQWLRLWCGNVNNLPIFWSSISR